MGNINQPRGTRTIKQAVVKLLFSFLLVLPPVYHYAQPVGQTFSSLTGTWSDDQGEGIFTETWKIVGPETLEGWGYYIAGQDTLMREYLRIDRIGEHTGYLASINGGLPTLFNLVEQQANRWTFNNPEHDFPQTIIYHLVDPKTLRVEVSGTMKGDHVTETYRLKRAD